MTQRSTDALVSHEWIDGTVSKWIEHRGFGFITTPSAHRSFFFHVSAVPSNADPEPHDLVSFQVARDGKTNRVKAVNLRFAKLEELKLRRDLAAG